MATYIAHRSFDDDLVVGTVYSRVDVALTQEQVTDMFDGKPIDLTEVDSDLDGYFLEDLPGYVEIGFQHGIVHMGTTEGSALIVQEAEIPKMLHAYVEWRKLAP